MNDCAEKEGTMWPHRDLGIPLAVYTLDSAQSIISNLYFHIIFRCSPSRVLCELPDIPLAVQHHLAAATPRAALTRFNVETSGFYSILRVNLTEKIFSWHNQSKIKLNSLHSEPTLQKTFFLLFINMKKDQIYSVNHWRKYNMFMN